MSKPVFRPGDAARVTRGKLAGWQGRYYENTADAGFGWVAFSVDPPRGAAPNLYNQQAPDLLNLHKRPRKLLATSQLETI